ncbi:asparagine synthase (glutamine-hydrolyzing) [Candidatus Margulisiibacteriota bacterium]
MCGIAGFIGQGNKDILLEMMDTLEHRGPDDQGTYIDGAVHLGHKRLSIIDLTEQGRQPLSNEDASLWLIFNGEIYNFPDLRKSLIAKGHRFKSKTDSEVILHLYEESGLKTFDLLNGMFAFALWDKKQQKLYLVRDKMGQKPLYYAFSKNSFIFASEASALLKHPLIEKKLNLRSAAKFLFYEHVPTPDCIWQNIAQLKPAAYLEYDIRKRDYRINKYWNLRYLPRLSLNEEDYVGVLEEKLIQAIKRHLVADVPVGVYLSGGMDSTTLAYYGQKILNGSLETFTVAFKEASFDEQFRARATAEKLKTKHHEIEFSAQDFIGTAFEIIPKLDVPFADSSLIPAYYLNKFAKANIKVALGGEGGDELFVGYPIFMAHQLLKYFRAIPAGLRRLVIVPLINRIKTSYKNETWTYRLKKFVEANDYLANPYYCQQIWLGAFGADRLLKLFKQEYHQAIGLDSLFANIDQYQQDAGENEELLDGLMRQTQHKYLMDDGLTKADRASMANSMEMRAPLLDSELVEWVNRIPFKEKYSRGKTKLVLKKLMQNKIPEDIIKGRKQGFTPPIAQWFAKSFQDQIKEYIFLDNGLFNLDYVGRLWEEHLSQRQNHRKILWALFVWNLWSAKNDAK